MISDPMQVPPGPVAKDNMEQSSPVHSTGLSSPYSQHSPKAPLSPLSRKPRWAKQFKLVHKSQDHTIRPDTFLPRSRVGTAHTNLAAINSTAGKSDCLAQTAKQWDTIIKQSKADDKVSDDMKAAKFLYFGHVLRDPKPAKPSETYVFVRRLSESEAKEEVEGLLLPLKTYAADRRRKIRRRQRPGPVHMGSKDPELQPMIPKSIGTTPDKLVSAATGFHGLRRDTIVQASSTQSSPVTNFKSGHDLDYLKFAAEEHLNDYELVKGVGRVPINQKIPEPIKPVEDKPWELPPNAWALRDLQFLLQKMISSDLNINNLMILPAAATLPNLDDPEALKLQWNGKAEQTITISKGREIKRIAFKNVVIIKYNRKESKLLFQFSLENSDKPEELLLTLLPVSDKIWQSLQTCCYSLIKGKPSKQQCDMEGPEFFEDKAKALMNLRIKRAPMLPYPNRPVPQVANRGQNARQKPRRPSKPLFQTRINPTPSLEAPDATPATALGVSRGSISNQLTASNNQPDAPRESSPNLVATPGNQQVPDNEDHGLVFNQGSLDIESEARANVSEAIARDSNIKGEKDTMIDVEPELEDPSPVGLYYKSTLRSGTPVPVGLNDLVVRLRSDTERETGGKRDKLDLFDGPWRIVEFDLPKNTHGMKLSIHKEEGDGNESPSLLQNDKIEAKKMLKTKVRLGFPREAHAVRWVELNQLLLITKLEKVRNGKLHASCWGVADLTAFKELESEMTSRNLEVFDPKHQMLIRESPEEQPTNTSGAEDDVDDDVDEDADEDEMELPMHIVEIKSDIFVAIMEADPKAVDDGDSYLVEKLRSKRLRLLKLNSPKVRKHKLKTDEEDSWVKRLLKEMPQLAVNRIVVSEYKVHWAGWPDEDDTWDIGTGNIAKGFIDEYHALTDLLRDLPADQPLANPKDMVFKDDLPKAGRGRSSVGSRQSTGSLGPARGNRRSTASSVANGEINNQGAKGTKKDDDEEMLDEDDDIALAKAVQASLDGAKAEKTKAHLKALQKAMGVTPNKFKTPATADRDLGAEDDGFMEIEGPDEGGENDVIMDKGDELEISDGYLGGGGDNDGDEV